MIATCIHYKGHTVYSDGRLYRNYELIGHYRTEAAAKARATVLRRREIAQRAAERHAALREIWEAPRG